MFPFRNLHNCACNLDGSYLSPTLTKVSSSCRIYLIPLHNRQNARCVSAMQSLLLTTVYLIGIFFILRNQEFVLPNFFNHSNKLILVQQ